MKIVLILLLFFLNSLSADKWENRPNTKIDQTAHIEWQDTSVIESTDLKWELAKKYCEGLHIGEKDDWRLPRKKELLGLAHDMQGQKKFQHLQHRVFWAIEEDSEDPVNSWAVYSANGHLSSNDKCDENAVICVRAHYEK